MFTFNNKLLVYPVNESQTKKKLCLLKELAEFLPQIKYF